MSLFLFHLNTGLNQDGFAFPVFHQTTYAFRKAYRPECSSGNSEQAESALHGNRIAHMIVQLFASYPEILPDFDEHLPLYYHLPYRHDRLCSLFLQDHETLTACYFGMTTKALFFS